MSICSTINKKRYLCVCVCMCRNILHKMKIEIVTRLANLCDVIKQNESEFGHNMLLVSEVYVSLNVNVKW